MSKIRVLVVDDSVVVRRLVSDVLSGDPAITVVGTAAHGRIALAKIPQVNPDLVTLDIEMPIMDGLETLVELRKTYPKLPVIMFSRFTQRGTAATVDALTLGASDYVSLPEGPGTLATAMERMRVQLIPKIKSLCLGGPTGIAGQSAAADAPRVFPANDDQHRLPRRVEIVAIGVSTGGPNALATILPRFPATFSVPIVIVQHMPMAFTQRLATRLSSCSQIPVREAVRGAPIGSGQVWLAPGDSHLQVSRGALDVALEVNRDPPENSCRPSVDVLFRSVAQAYGPGALAVVLTGLGQDGLRGCEHIRAAGGQIIVQDEASSVVWGMPGLVAKAGLADQILPLDQIGFEIVRKVGSGQPLAHVN